MTDLVGELALHERFMREAIAEAALAASAGDVPVGCVLVRDGEIIARAHNHRQRAQDPTAHAELLALREASQRIGSFRMIGVTAYVTLEPCPMCAGALVNARVPCVVYGCDDPKAGAVCSLYNIGTDARLNHRFELVRGVLATECSSQLSGFFAALRKSKASDPK
ncbi:MAG TPA: tRNA adenosine(34) deaminase TadA [Polyangiales bacterium]|jgi:tRNA(adenine34) deaminase|nr:tRNA adenosine(34) deaminase TadA [Polyangiales bacterium]